MPFAMEEEHQEDIGIFGGIVMSDILPNGEEVDHADNGVATASHDGELDDLDDDDDDDDEEDIANVAPIVNMDVIDAILDEAVRPLRSASPSKPPSRKTPHSAKTASAPASAAASSGRKRKSAALEAEPEATPAKRRGRPPGTATSARLAAKAARGAARGRPKREASTNVAKAAGKRGRPKKSATTSKGEAEGKVPAGEYEVEEIVDSAIDADTLEHMYRVKWKGYSLKETTWEPRKNLKHSAELVRSYDAKMKKARKDEAAAGTDKEVKKAKKKPGRKPKAKA